MTGNKTARILALAAAAAWFSHGAACAAGDPAAQSPAPPAAAAASATNPPQGGTPAGPPALKLSKQDETLIADLAKIAGKPLTYDQKVEILKAAREFRSIVRAGKSILDDRVAKALSMTTDELHEREKKHRQDEALRKATEATKGAAPSP